MTHWIKMKAYRLGRLLMHLNYIKGTDCVEHDLRLEVQELKRVIDMMKRKGLRK